MKEIISTIKRLTLTQHEKDFMRENLVVYMNLKRAVSQKLTFSSVFSLKPLFSRAVPVALAVVVAAGGVTFAAGDALPGELLYGVKVNVIEKVQSAAAVGSEAEVKLQANFAAKRLKEAEKLAVKGNFTSENKATIEAKFKEHTESISSNLVEIEGGAKAEVAVEVSAEVESSLTAHGDILEKLSANTDPTTKSDIAVLVGEIRQAAKNVAASNEKVEEKITNESNAAESRAIVEEKKKAAEASVVSAEAYFRQTEHLFSERTQFLVREQLQEAKTALDFGTSQLDAGRFIDAYRQFRLAQNISHEAVVTLEIALELNTEIHIGPSPDTGTSTPPINESPENEGTTTPPAPSEENSGQDGSGSSIATSTAGNSLFEKVKNIGL